MTCTLILHSTVGTCPSCGREVMAPEWNKRSRQHCYWCGFEGEIPCGSPDGCIPVEPINSPVPLSPEEGSR